MSAPDARLPHGEPSEASVTLRYALGGLVASAILAFGAVGVGWLPADTITSSAILETLHTDPVGQFVSRSAVIIGGALLLQAWLVIGADVLHGHLRDLRRLWAILALWTAPLLLAPPLFSRDVYSYFFQGKLVLAGQDPYTQGVASIPGWFQNGVDPMWQDTPTPYGPLWLALSRGVADIAGDNAYLAVLAFRLLAVCGVALLAWYVPRLAFHCGIDASKALWLAVMNPLVLMHFVAGVHNDALMIGLLVAGACYAIEGRGALGVALVMGAAMVKPIALLALPFVGIMWAGSVQTGRQRWLAWLKTGVVAAVTYAVVAFAVGASFGWIQALTTPGEVRTWLSPMTALGMATGNFLSAVGLGDHTDTTVTFFRLIGMAAAVVIVALLVLRPQGRTAVRSMMLAFLTVVVLGPVVQPWYLLWVLPLAAASGLSRRELRAVMLLTAGFTLYGLWETSASADPLLELSDGLAMFASAVAVVVAVTASRRERRLLFGPPEDHGLLPEDAPAAARGARLVVRGPEAA